MAAERLVVVLGAGINGAAIARELALSGVGVVVIDADDAGGGATAWSTRLVHGGLRDLEYGELALVRESLAERDRLVRLAEHLVRPLPFFLPVRGRTGGMLAAAARLAGLETLALRGRGSRGRGLWAVGAGLSLYDLLATGVDWPRHRLVRAGGAALPAVDAATFPFAAVYADAQMLFPERFTVELLVDARSLAAAAGARFEVLTHHAVRPAADGRRLVATAMSGVGGGVGDGAGVELRPDAIVNVTGAWVDRTLDAILPPAGPATRRPLIGGTKGSHLVLHAPALRRALAGHGVYAEAADGRPVFVLPFGPTLVLVGTTDIPFAGDPGAARADDEEIDYLLAAVNRLFPPAAASRADVQQHYCGVRPLPSTAPGADGAPPAGITRRHLLVRQPDAPLPCWSVVGGKLTTCRSLAEQVAAEVLPALGLPVRGTSRDRPLPGSYAGSDRGRAVAEAVSGGIRAGLAAAAAERAGARLATLLGARAGRVWGHCEGPADAALLEGSDLPAAAVRYCVREEWAATVDDVVCRRLMLSFDERLRRGTVRDVAVALEREGRLAADGAAAAADACVERLERCHGRVMPPAGPG